VLFASVLMCTLLLVHRAGLDVPEWGLRGGSACCCVRKSSGTEVLGALDVRARARVCMCVAVCGWGWGWARAGELRGISVREPPRASVSSHGASGGIVIM
jgi:hypothetical protein